MIRPRLYLTAFGALALCDLICGIALLTQYARLEMKVTQIEHQVDELPAKLSEVIKSANANLRKQLNLEPQ